MTILQKFDAGQIENIIGKVVPLIADKKDHEFFRGILFVKAEQCKSSAEFTVFIDSLIKSQLLTTGKKYEQNRAEDMQRAQI